MRFLKNLLYFLVVLAALALGTLFAVQNTQTVPLDLLVVYLPERSVALWVLLAFAGGGLIGMMTSIGLVLRLRGELKRARRQPATAAKPAPEKAAATQIEQQTAVAPKTDLPSGQKPA